MIHVKLDINLPTKAILRQTPNSAGCWGDHVFHVNESIRECDYWVVYDQPKEISETRCNPLHTLLVTGEPPSVCTYHRSYLTQFARVITSHPKLSHSNCVLQQQSLPWHVGRRQWMHENLGWSKCYDELKALSPSKNKELSLICSTAAGTQEHRKRNSFVQALTKRLGGQVDVFGRGRREIADKWDALAPYKYTIVLENSCHLHYWTEKLADAFLAGCFPIYCGCLNLDEYFPEDCFVIIDINKPNAAIRTIETIVNSCTFEKSRAAIRAARELVLDRYNLFAMLADACPPQVTSPTEVVRIRPYHECEPITHRVIRRVKHQIHRLQKTA